MKRKLLALTLPIGLLIWLAYTLVGKFVYDIPDTIGYPAMIISIVLMLIGITYHGYCFGKKKSPYDFK